MESSDNAFEMRILIVLSAETANIAIFSWYFYFQRHLFNCSISYNSKYPITIVNASIPIASGAATIGEKRPTPVIPNAIAVTLKQLSITQLILTPLLYFV